MKLNSEQITPVDSNVLIKPGKLVKIPTLQTSAPKAKVDVEGKDIMETETHYEKQPTKFRLGTVLAVAASLHDIGYAVGDTVIYNTQRAFAQKLDLLASKSDDEKCPLLMKNFEIVGKVNNG